MISIMTAMATWMNRVPPTRYFWYQDADDDGYGDGAVTMMACNQPSGYVLNASDCSDVYASMYPGAPDLCDGLINDCTVSDLTDAESDLDGDGFVECTIDASGWVRR